MGYIFLKKQSSGPLCGAIGESSLEVSDHPLGTGLSGEPFPRPPPKNHRFRWPIAKPLDCLSCRPSIFSQPLGSAVGSFRPRHPILFLWAGYYPRLSAAIRPIECQLESHPWTTLLLFTLSMAQRPHGYPAFGQRPSSTLEPTSFLSVPRGRSCGSFAVAAYVLVRCRTFMTSSFLFCFPLPPALPPGRDINSQWTRPCSYT